MFAEPLNHADAVIATLLAKIAIADARSQWGTKKQRAEQSAAAATYRAKLSEAQNAV
jgi:hypothetical protein